MTLGLRRGEVRLVAHDPEWHMEFIRERARLREALGPAALEIEHVGSTAVAGLPAKPIIDIAIAVRDVDDTCHWSERLKPHGYSFFGDRENRGDEFYAKGPEESRTVYLHVVPLFSERWKEYLQFRDVLRASPSLREEYAALKFRLCEVHSAERARYTAAKTEWIAKVVRREPNKTPEPTPTAVTPRAIECKSK